MKNNYKLFIMLLLATTISFAQQTLLLDLGDEYVGKHAPGNWNNMTSGVYGTQPGDHAIADMVNDAGTNTGFSFAITGAFQYFGGYGNLVTDTPMTGAAAAFPTEAVRDYFFTKSDEDANGEITFSNLDNAKFYYFEIFASRKSAQNRETQYTITGTETQTIYLNPGGAGGSADGNISNTVISVGIQPQGGNITIGVTNGPNSASIYSYINCLKMVETTTTASLEDEVLANGGLQLYPNPVEDVLNINYTLTDSTESSILIYDITGRLIYNVTNALNQTGTYSYKWNRLDNSGKSVSAGMYLLSLKTNTKTVTKKLILK